MSPVRCASAAILVASVSAQVYKDSSVPICESVACYLAAHSRHTAGTQRAARHRPLSYLSGGVGTRRRTCRRLAEEDDPQRKARADLRAVLDFRYGGVQGHLSRHAVRIHSCSGLRETTQTSLSASLQIFCAELVLLVSTDLLLPQQTVTLHIAHRRIS